MYDAQTQGTLMELNRIMMSSPNMAYNWTMANAALGAQPQGESVSQPVSQSVNLSVSQSVSQSVCQSVSQSVNLSVNNHRTSACNRRCSTEHT